MMVISFKEDNAVKQIISKKVIATMRNYAKNVYTNIKIYAKIDDKEVVGEGVIVLTAMNIQVIRKALLKYSGFKDEEEWINTAKKIYKKDKPPKYILLIKIKDLRISEAKQEIEEINEQSYEIL